MRVPFINYLVLVFSACLTLGIVSSNYLHATTPLTVSPLLQFTTLAITLCLLAFVRWRNAKQLRPSLYFGILVCIIFFEIGFSTHSLRLPIYQTNHFTQHISEGTPKFLQLKINTQLKPNRFYNNYLAEVIATDTIKTNGLLLLRVKKKSLTHTLVVDDIILLKGTPNPILEPQNPYQFKYANYMKSLGVYASLNSASSAILKQQKGTTTLHGFSERIRTYLISKLRQTVLQDDALAIVQALILGQRKDIDKQLYNAYAAAGAIHILAVSGLHVGLLYLILASLLRPLTYLKYGNTIRSSIVVLLLWGFALLTGLSPSVVRAVTMFSFFSFATTLNRPTNSFNTLLLSFFILLLLAPNWLFHVGFQLSYLAVFGILWIQPKLYTLYKPSYYLDKLFWSISTVTIAAQLGIIPLSLYYFHQFPGLFFITNIVIIPFLGILLAGGLLLVVLTSCNLLPNFYAEGYNYTIELLNTFVSWIAQQDAFLFTNIPFSEADMLTSYAVLIGCVLLWKKHCGKNLLFTLTSVALFIGICIWNKKTSINNELVIFHKNRSTLIGVKQAKKLTVLVNDTINIGYPYPLKPYSVAKRIEKTEIMLIPKVFGYATKTIVVLDSLGVYSSQQKADIVLLTYSSKVNLNRLIDSLQPKLIVADGSNYKSYIMGWRTTCRQKKLPFHHTGTKGAFTLK